MTVGVTGATLQGSVDRQRPVTAPWLGLQLPAAITRPPAATLEVSMLERKRMEEGDQILFRWKWNPRDPNQAFPKSVNADMVGAADIRIIDAKADPKDKTAGTFLVTTTKLTRPAKYDLYISGRLMVDGQQQDIVSRPIPVEVMEVEVSQVLRRLILTGSLAVVAFGAENRVTFLRDVAPILNKVGLHLGNVPRRRQGQERIQALAARVRPAIRLRSLALRSFRPPIQSRRTRQEPHARQAHAGSRSRRRAALREGLRLLQDHLRLDQPGRPLRRSRQGYRRGPAGGTERDPHAQAGRDRHREGDRAVQRWTDPRRHARSHHRIEHARPGEGWRVRRGEGRAHRRSDAAGPLSGQVLRPASDGPESQAGLRLECRSRSTTTSTRRSTPNCSV